MELHDRTLLGIAEVDESFVAPEALPDSTAFHFRRYPRPSQGILTGRRTNGLMVVWISANKPELTQPLRDWADFVHLRHIAASGIPGFTQITPYENALDEHPRFMHFYELDADDPETTCYQMMHAVVGARLGGFDTPAFKEFADWESVGCRVFYSNTFTFVGETVPGS